jgi:dephospho-CoA kinase
MAKLLKIGLTGGIAAGKSTVAQRWQQAGAIVIDTDELAHRALEHGSPTWQEVVREFGREILNADQTVNRQKLGEIVFRDESKRLALNRIVHPAVRKMQADLLARCEREGRAEFVLVTVPLLYEVGAERDFDCVVTVACSEQTQLARLTATGLSEE